MRSQIIKYLLVAQAEMGVIFKQLINTSVKTGVII